MYLNHRWFLKSKRAKIPQTSTISVRVPDLVTHKDSFYFLSMHPVGSVMK